MQSNGTSLHTPVRWGVLSAANIGVKRVAPAIHASSNGRLVAVGSRNPERARELFAFAPDTLIYGDYNSVISDPEIEALYIPLPNSLHAEWTIKALKAGKHVLCEKPLAVTAEEGLTMVNTAQDTGMLLMEAFMYRFHPQTVWALEQISAGRIGNVKLAGGNTVVGTVSSAGLFSPGTQAGVHIVRATSNSNTSVSAFSASGCVAITEISPICRHCCIPPTVLPGPFPGRNMGRENARSA